MSEASIEKINIQINADSKKASKGLDDLITSLKKLQNYANSLEGVSAKLQSLANSVKSLSGIKLTNINSVSKSVSKLSEMVKEFNAIGDINASKVQSISKVFEAFTDAPSNRITSYLKSIRQLPKMVSEINNMPEIDKSKIQSITEAFNSFSSVGENKSGGMIRKLKQLPDIAQKINSMDMDNFTQSMKAVSNALEPLSLQADRIKGMFNGMPSSMARAISGNNSLKSSNNNLQKSFSSLTGKITIFIGKLTAIYYGANRLINVFKECFDESSSYIENLNLFNVTMGSAAKSSLEFAESVSHALGIDPSEFIKYQGIFNRMTSGFGTSSDKALLMSKNLTQLGYDIASFFNVDIETSMEKLESALAGQIKGVKEYGYNLSVAAIQETAYSLGLKENVSDMTEAQKSQLRYITLIQKSNEVMGDMGRTINTPANALRILEEQWTQLKRAIGNVISMVVVKLLPYIQAFVKLCAEGANYLAELWGFELPEIDYSSLTSGANALDDTSDGLDQISESAEETAKKISSLAGFDELNILSFGNDSSKDDKSDEKPSYDLGIDLPEYDFLEGLDSQSDEIYQKMKDGLLKVIDKFKEFWGWIKKNKEFLEKLGGVLAVLWATSKIKKFLGFVAGLFSPFKKLFDLIKGTSAFTKLSGWFKNATGEGTALSNVLKGIKSFLGVGIGSALSFFSAKDLFYGLTAGTLDWKNALFDALGIAGGLGLAFAAGGPVGLVVGVVAGIAGAIYGWCAAERDLEIEMAKNKYLYNGKGKTSLDDMYESFKNCVDEITGSNQKFIDLGDDIEEAGKKVSDASGKVEGLMTKFSTANTKITQTDVKELKEAIGDLATFSKEKLEVVMQGAIDSVSEAFKTLKTDATGTKDEIISAFYLVGSQGNEMIAEAQKKANSLVDKLGTMKKDSKEYKKTYEALSKEVEKISGLSLNTDTSVEDFDEMISRLFESDEIEDLNFESEDDVKEFMSKIESYYNESVDGIEKAYKAQVTAINQLRSTNNALNKEGKGVSDEIFSDALINLREATEQKKELLEKRVQDAGKTLEQKLNVAGTKVYLELDGVKDFRGIFDHMEKEGVDWEFQMKAIRERAFESDAWEDTVGPAISAIKDSFSNMNVEISDEFAQNPQRLYDALNTFNNLCKFQTIGSSLQNEFISAYYKEFEKNGGVVKKIPSEIADKLKEGWNKLPEGFKEFLIDIGFDVNTGEFDSAIDRAKKKLAELSLSAVSSGFDLISSAVMKNQTVKAKKYATGGYPTTGQMFIAREAGPEMVGKIGSRTAVANNDQITSAIAQAVEAAILRAGGMFTQRQTAAASGDTYVFIDSEEIASRMERRSSSRNIRTNGRG